MQHQIPTIVRPRRKTWFDSTRSANHNLLIPLQRMVKGTSFPKIFFSNARSMMNKMDEIFGSVSVNLCDIVVIVESWLTSSVTNELISMPGYVTCRKDRPNNQRGGGLCTFINSRFNFVELCELSEPEIESQWFLIKPDRLPRGINSIIFGTVYHPPQNDDKTLRSHLFKCLDSSLTAHPNSAIVVVGDFNHFKPANLFSSFKLKKLVTKPTRGNNILDQAYSTLSHHYDTVILPPLGLSDHSSVLLKPTGKHAPSLPTTQIQRRDCRASNRRTLISTLEVVNWTSLYRLNSCEDQLNVFQSVVLGACNSCLPMRSVKLHSSDKPWITSDIKDSIKKRQQAWVKGELQQYKFHRNKVSQLCKVARRRFYHDRISCMKDTNPKKWWDNIKLLSGLSKPSTLKSMIVNGAVLKDADLVEAINESLGRVADDIPPLKFTPIPVSHIPDKYIISPEAIECSLSGLQERKSVGPDGIPNWLLKNFASGISRPMSSIFNSSIREGHCPSLWKCADVLPLGKIPQPRSIDTDLRPISLTAVLSKVLEGFMFNWLASIIMPNIDPFQFGGVKKSSTTHALVHLIHQWLSAMETPNTFVRSCLIDFSKAFDRIDHNILMYKLQILNVPPVLLNWCASFLQDRQQRVKLGVFKSKWKRINAGVPQGTKLGPLFFLVMVNDLSTELPMYKYVDDSTVSEVMSTKEMDSSTIQQEVDNINQWSTDNNMKLNVKKTKEFTLSFLKTKPSLEPLIINNRPIEVVHTAKLLGVQLSSNLKWNAHIDYVCSKASKRLFALRMLKRNGVHPRDLRSVYCYFIRPVLEYACPVWHSSLPSYLSDQVEHIQRRATKVICPSLSYSQSLTELALPTLFDRRESLCKSFYRNNLNTTSKLFDLLPRPVHYQYNLRNARKIPQFKSRTKRFSDSFLPYCVKKWDACI